MSIIIQMYLLNGLNVNMDGYIITFKYLNILNHRINIYQIFYIIVTSYNIISKSYIL